MGFLAVDGAMLAYVPVVHVRQWRASGARHVARGHIACTKAVLELTAASTPSQREFGVRVLELQDHICDQVKSLEPSALFVEDVWARSGGGGGRTRVIEDGDVVEKGAVNVSIIRGQLTPERAQSMRARGRMGIEDGGEFFAAALSLVLHPASPLVPTLRGDVRVFQTLPPPRSKLNEACTWGGGGADLTPSYLYEEDAVEFHTFWRNVCDRHDPRFYARFKRWCDEYFYIPMRCEHRGIGGIFFDDLSFDADEDTGGRFDHLASFLDDVARGLVSSCEGVVRRRSKEVYTEEQRDWQLLRRGRYAEFNLLYDRGVRFGLQSGGRVESIMVSGVLPCVPARLLTAPPLVRWKYTKVDPPAESREAQLLQVLREPRDWIPLD